MTLYSIEVIELHELHLLICTWKDIFFSENQKSCRCYSIINDKKVLIHGDIQTLLNNKRRQLIQARIFNKS